MRYAIFISGAPTSGAPEKALLFIQTCLDLQHHLTLVFFHQAAVSLALDPQALSLWQTLQAARRVPLYLCSTAAEHHHLMTPPLGFSFAGLGHWIEQSRLADTIITFKAAS